MEIVRRDRVEFGSVSTYTQFVYRENIFTKIYEATVTENGMERTINAVGFDGTLGQFGDEEEVQILPIKVFVG